MTPEERADLAAAARAETARVYGSTVPEHHNQPRKHVPPRTEKNGSRDA